MIEAFFFNLQEVNGLRGRDKDAGDLAGRKVAGGAPGMMGAGIAYQCAKNGIEVVRDVSVERRARQGLLAGLVDKAVGTRPDEREDADALLARITATANAADAGRLPTS